MAYLVRKFHRPSWQPDERPPRCVEQVGADVFSKCLVTDKNKLSVWEAESSEWGEFDDILAAMFSTLDGPSRADIVLVEKKEVDKIEGVELDEVPGDSIATSETNQKHRDLTNLKIGSFTSFASLILGELGKEKVEGKIKRYNVSEMLKVVDKGIQQGVIAERELGNRWKRKLEGYRNKQA